MVWALDVLVLSMVWALDVLVLSMVLILLECIGLHERALARRLAPDIPFLFPVLNFMVFQGLLRIFGYWGAIASFTGYSIGKMGLCGLEPAFIALAPVCACIIFDSRTELFIDLIALGHNVPVVIEYRVNNTRHVTPCGVRVVLRIQVIQFLGCSERI